MATPNAAPSSDIDYYSFATYKQSADYLASRLPDQLRKVDVGVICGSGLGGLADTIQEPRFEIQYKDIPNFAVSTVPGHAGKLVFGMLSGKATVCMVGRKHAYEGHSLMRTVFPIRVMSLLGVKTLVVTNAAGGLNPAFNVGDIMVIEDHLNAPGMAGLSALIGPNVEAFGPRFPAVSDAYDFDLRVAVMKAAKLVGLADETIREGVYVFVAGPSFESRAEARYLRSIGADCVGMSTVPEIVVARHAGLKVVGISLITNMVNQSHSRSAKRFIMGDTSQVADESIANHEEVLAIGAARSIAVQSLVANVWSIQRDQELHMGNLSSTFAIGEQIASGGPGNLWKVSNATRKSTGLPVAVFMFERNFLDSVRASVTTKKDQDRAHELLKKEATTLSRLRHPCLLEVAEAVADSPTVLAFGSEPLLCCLSNVFGNFTNFGSDTAHRAEFKSRYDLDELEIQKGILQLIKGLEFLHTNRWIHCCLSPESIYINAKAANMLADADGFKGDWKISGLNFSHQAASSSDSVSFYLADYPPFCSPSIDYLAPEIIFDDKCFAASDLWSLGCLLFAVFNSGTPLIASNSNVHSYKTKVSQLDQMQFNMKLIPSRLIEPLKRLLVRDPLQRMTLQTLQNCEFFDNILINTINFLETIVEKTPVNRAQFLKGLVQVLPQFSTKLLTRKILPMLANQLKDPSIVEWLLSIFWISDQVTDDEFNSIILPALKPMFKISDPPQAVLLLLSRMDIFAKKCPSADVFKQDVMPLLYSALDIPVVQVQEQAVKIVPALVARLDFSTIKSSLFPKLQTIYTSSTSLSVRVGALIAIHSTVKLLDKFTLTEKIVPLLKQNKVREPSILVALLAVHAEVANYLDREAIATEVLPELWKLAVDQVLNANQFKKFMRVIHELTAKVEDQHTKFLEEMKSMNDVSQLPATKSPANPIPSFSSLLERSSEPSAAKPSVDGPKIFDAFDNNGILVPSIVPGGLNNQTSSFANTTLNVSLSAPPVTSTISTNGGHSSSSFAPVTAPSRHLSSPPTSVPPTIINIPALRSGSSALRKPTTHTPFAPPLSSAFPPPPVSPPHTASSFASFSQPAVASSQPYHANASVFQPAAISYKSPVPVGAGDAVANFTRMEPQRIDSKKNEGLRDFDPFS